MPNLEDSRKQDAGDGGSETTSAINCGYLISVLSIVPPKKGPKLYC
jgi:hypothetical protein